MTIAKEYRSERHAQVHQIYEVTGNSKGDFDGTERFAKMSAEVNAGTTEAATMFATQQRATLISDAVQHHDTNIDERAQHDSITCRQISSRL